MKQLFYLFSFIIGISLQMSIETITSKSIKNDEIFNTLLFEEVTTESLSSFGALQKCGDSGHDVCVPYYNCDPVTNTILLPIESGNHSDVDIRSDRPCEHILEVCCDILRIIVSPPIHSTSTTNSPAHLLTTTAKKEDEAITPQKSKDDKTELTENYNCGNWSICGQGSSNGISFKLLGNMHNIAQYGEFPWQVFLLRTDYRGRLNSDEIICGGSIIQQNIVLTAAHCITGFSPSEISVRAGEWDIQTTIEPIPYQNRLAKKFAIHEGYNQNKNDIALILLDRPLIKVKSVASICLPDTEHPIDYSNCFASGWGRQYIGGQIHNSVMLKKIRSMVISESECQTSIAETSQRSKLSIHQSHICAKGEKGLDACGADGGGPLVCSHVGDIASYVQIGIISKISGCNMNNPVDIYTDVIKFTTWIKDNIAILIS